MHACLTGLLKVSLIAASLVVAASNAQAQIRIGMVVSAFDVVRTIDPARLEISSCRIHPVSSGTRTARARRTGVFCRASPRCLRLVEVALVQRAFRLRNASIRSRASGVLCINAAVSDSANSPSLIAMS